MARKPHYVIIPGAKGGEKYPLKSWLRANLKEVDGEDLTEMTSHEMRRLLEQHGWQLQPGDEEVLVIKPDSKGSIAYASTFVEISNEIDAGEDAEEITFGLERDMQQALRRSIDQLEPGLKIVDGGRERSTEAGRIDILAQDKTGSFVVIELKVGDAKPEVIAQIASYMTCITETEKKKVRGILVAGDFPPRVKLAARMIPSLNLKRYSFKFAFEAMA